MEAGKAAWRTRATSNSTWSTRWSRRRSERVRRGRWWRSSAGVSRPAVLLRHVHRELHELPDRGAGAVASGQRLAAGDPRRPPEPVPQRPASGGGAGKALTTSRTTPALPRSIATFEAFENAIALDIAMGGSTNTVLHLLAAAHEGAVNFTMADIDRMSRRVPNLCKVAPATQQYHMEDVHRAGGDRHPGRTRSRRADPPRPSPVTAPPWGEH